MALGRSVVVYTDTGSFTLAVGDSFTIPYGSTATINIRQAGVDSLVLKSGASLFTILPNNVDNVFNVENLSRTLGIYNNNLTNANLSVSNSTTASLEIWKDGVLYQVIPVGESHVYSVLVGSLIELKSTTPYRIGGANYNSNIGSGYSIVIASALTLLVGKALFNITVQNNSVNIVQLYKASVSPNDLAASGTTTFQLLYGDLLQIGSSFNFRVGSTDYLTPSRYSLTIVNSATITVLSPTSLYVDNGYWNIGYTV